MKAQWQELLGLLPGYLQGTENIAIAGLRNVVIVSASWLAIATPQRAIRTLRMRIASRLAFPAWST